MHWKRLLLVWGVLFLSLGLVSAALAAAGSARDAVLQVGDSAIFRQVPVAAAQTNLLARSAPAAQLANNEPKLYAPANPASERPLSYYEPVTWRPDAPDSPSGSSAWDVYNVWAPTVISESGQFEMWYSSVDRLENRRQGLATSPEGITWTKSASNPLVEGCWEAMAMKEGSVYKMWCSGDDYRIYYITSTNGEDWTPLTTPVLSPTNQAGSWEKDYIGDPSLVKDGSGIYWMYYEAYNKDLDLVSIGVATSTNGVDWNRPQTDQALAAGDPGDWDEGGVLDPMVILDGGTFRMWYTGFKEKEGQIGYATSGDGLHWTKRTGNPVFSPNPGGWDWGWVGDHSIYYDGVDYDMWYSSINRIGYVTSTDGLTWTRFLSDAVLMVEPALFIDVNYAHDWVIAIGGPDTPVTITVDDGGGVFTVTGQIGSNGWFGSWNGAWEPEAPDIAPGNAVTATAGGLSAAVNPVGTIVLDELDLAADTISGTLAASHFDPMTLTVRCEVWVDNGPPAVMVDGVAADGGNFLCDFSSTWDLQAGQDVAVMYFEPDQDLVIDVFQGPWMRVNYGHDWVGGNYPAGHGISVTVSDGGGIKASAGLATQPGWGWGGDGFETQEGDWDPQTPDIQAGDWVTITSDDGYSNTIHVGEIRLDKFDADANTVSGTIHTDFGPLTLTVRCAVWVENGPPEIEITGVPADGGSFFCDFSSEWILQPDQDVAVMYFEPDQDLVINVFQGPWMRVNYDHDWVGGNYPAGHGISVTLSDGGGVKANAELDTQPGRGWGGDGFETREEDWDVGVPDIQVGDWVTITSDDDYSNTIHVGEIRLDEFSIADDTISGTIYTDFDPLTLTVYCEVWVESGPPLVEVAGVPADGGSFLCDFSSEWDLLPGQDVAVMYIEPDFDRVIAVFYEPAPNMRIEKWVDGGGEAAPGGPLAFTIRYNNEGEAAATSFVITDTLPISTSYLTDTSGVTASFGAGTVSWTFGALDPGEQGQFYVVLTNTAIASDTLVNQVDIIAPNEVDFENNHAEAEVHINDGTPDLWVNKNPEPGDPTPGQTFLYRISYGNNSSVASGPVTLTDTLPLSTTVVDWFSENGYAPWSEVSRNGELILQAPTIPGNWGDNLLLRLQLDAGVSLGTQLTNTIEITTSGDSDSGNNWAQNTDAWTSGPRWDGYVDKNLNWGVLTPGGEVEYHIHVQNNGNLATHFWLTDTLPVSVYFQSAWSGQGSNYQPFPPDVDDGQFVAWDLGVLEPGEWLGLDLRLDIDPGATAGTVLTNCAEVVIADQDGWLDNNQSCVIESVHGIGANLRVVKNYQWNWEGQLNYEIRFLNLGTTVMENVSLTDTLPLSVSFSGNWWHDFWQQVWLTDNYTDSQLIWTLERLEPRWSSALHFEANLDPAIHYLQGLSFTNTVEAPIAGDVDTSDNSDMAVAHTGPDVYIEKWLSGGELRPGEVVTFTIEFGNLNMWPWNGDVNFNSYLTDTLPAEMAFITATAPWNPNERWAPFTQTGNALVWEWGPMGGQSVWRFDVAVSITDTVSAGQVMTNTVEAYGNSPSDVEYNWNNNIFDLILSIVKFDLYLPLVIKH